MEPAGIEPEYALDRLDYRTSAVNRLGERTRPSHLRQIANATIPAADQARQLLLLRAHARICEDLRVSHGRDGRVFARIWSIVVARCAARLRGGEPCGRT